MAGGRRFFLSEAVNVAHVMDGALKSGFFTGNEVRILKKGVQQRIAGDGVG